MHVTPLRKRKPFVRSCAEVNVAATEAAAGTAAAAVAARLTR